MTGPSNDERRPCQGGAAVEKWNGFRGESTAPQAPDAMCRDLHVVVGPRNSSWITGTPSVRGLLRRLDCPTMFDRERGAWAIPTDRLDDVLVAAEYQDRRFVTIENAA